MNVSIIIPVCAESKTIAESIASLRAQQFAGWEAIVVDTGASREQIAAVAHSADQDARVRLVHRPGISINDARNAGARLARYKWLLFCDPEDRLQPEALARLTHVAAADPSLDAVYSRWAHMAPDRALLPEEFWGAAGDMFETFAFRPAFPPHGCVVRASAFQAVGGFDTGCTTCADWDLWQRIARLGARFGMVDEPLALVAMRPHPDTTDLHQLLADGLRLIALGQAPDPRVAHLRPAHADGLPAERAPNARFIYACTVAGLALGRGEDPRALLNALQGERAPGIDPYETALSIFTTALRSAGRGPAGWAELWPAIERPVGEFLAALEAYSQSAGLARRVQSRLERLILEHAPQPRPLTIGATHGVRVEIGEPISDLAFDASIERVNCLVAIEGQMLGTLELPVCDRAVPVYVLADAIASQFAWPILGGYFERTVYRDLSLKHGPDGASLYQGSECLATELPADPVVLWQQAHDQIGWTIFLQQLWGSLDEQVGAIATLHDSVDGQLALEISEPFSNIKVSGAELKIVPMVGGVALGVVPVAAHGDLVTADELRSAIATACGFELCRAAVREGVLGWPLAATPALRERLAQAYALQRARTLILHPSASQLPSGPAWASDEGLSDQDQADTLVLGQRDAVAIGTSASRRARLPLAAARELLEAATVAGEPVIETPLEYARSALYMPDVLRSSATATWSPATAANAATGTLASENRSESRRIDRRQPYTATKPTITRIWRKTAPIARAFEKGLRRAGKLRSPIYRGRLLRRVRRARLGLPQLAARIITLAKPILPANVRKSVLARATVAPSRAAQTLNTDRLPILMYHRIAPTGLAAMGKFRVTPEAFERQLRYLRDAGYRSITLEEWQAAQQARRPVPGRAVLLTFDDGYVDFLEYAWPLLTRYGFSALVFLVAGHVGRSNDWDHIYGEEVPLMGWNEIHWLKGQGVTFGSHTASHRPLTALPAEEVVREVAHSRALLQRELGAPINAISYPYGDIDPTVLHLTGACGYRFGVSARPSLSSFQDSALALPRIEVTGDDDLKRFAAKLGLV